MRLRSIRSGKLACVLLLSFGCSFVTAAEEDAGYGWWPQWRGPNRDAVSTDTGLLDDWEKTPPKLLWMADGLGSGYANISLVGERIYTTGDLKDGQAVIALNAADGSIVWTKTLTQGIPKHGYPGSRCTPTVDGDRLYVVTSDEKSGGIVCLQASDGAVVWQKGFHTQWGGKMMSEWGFSESPLVDGKAVICTPGSRQAMLVALDKMTGEELWRSSLPPDSKLSEGAGYSSIVISEGAGERQYVTLTGCGVVGVRASDGEFLWSYPQVANDTANIPTCLVNGDFVFSANGYNQGAGLVKLFADGSGVKAQEVYFLNGKDLQNQHGGMILHDGHIYPGHGKARGYPTCVEFATGKIVWGGKRQKGVGRGEAGVVFADGNIIFRSADGTVAMFQATPKEFQLKGTLEPEFQEGKSWAHPVVVGGRLYLREQEKLMCYDLRKT
jgi:outer membrane protein assembly factor BamB